jgi:hypothetical protein
MQKPTTGPQREERLDAFPYIIQSTMIGKQLLEVFDSVDFAPQV